MTALVYWLQPRLCEIGMDTLAVTKPERAQDAQQRIDMSKLLYLPHTQTVVCAAGRVGFFRRWVLELQERYPDAGDVVALDRYTTSGLRRLWEAGGYATGRSGHGVCHFGWDPASGEVRGYRYESRDGFASHAIAPGLYYAPSHEGLPAAVSRVGAALEAETPRLSRPAFVARLFVATIGAMQRHQATRARGERIDVGGAVTLLTLWPGGARFDALGRLPEPEPVSETEAVAPAGAALA